MYRSVYIYVCICPTLDHIIQSFNTFINIIIIPSILPFIMLFQRSRPQSLFESLLVLANVAFAARDGLCPPLGPVLPAPITPSSHESVQAAIQSITDRFQNLTAALNTTAISVAVRSIHETLPMLEFHYTPPVLDKTGASAIDSETIYRIGSISKIFAALSVLTQGKMKLEDPITKYVPELLQLKRHAVPVANDVTAVNWDQVTIGSLASHMSGIGTDRRCHVRFRNRTHRLT